MRKTYEYGSTGSAVLETEEKDSARPAGKPRRAVPDTLQQPRALTDTYDEDTEAFLRASGRARRIRRGIIPRTRTGRIAAGVGLVLALIAAGVAWTALKHYATTSETFRIRTSTAIEIDGNTHLTRSQMLSVFGEDIERNIFKVPMVERRAALEQMPWIEHATVMRLLPNRIRVHVTERTPVAFVRQGGSIGMVDARGVLLDIPPDAPGNPNYTFPVVTGIKANDSAAARAARMKLYSAFLRDLDSDGKGTSAQLSEVDLSDPEDVKALIPVHNVEVLVHFGTENFLVRFKKFEDHIAEWRQQYPRLSGVDMRYERQVVLQMPPKDSTVVGGPQLAANADARPLLKPVAASTARPVVLPKPTPPGSTPAPSATAKPVPAKNAKPTGKPTAKDAATQKRVEAIRAWMAKRQKLRDAAKSNGPQSHPDV